MWSSACDSNSTSPVLMSISWTTESTVGLPTPGRWTGEVAMMYASPCGATKNSCSPTSSPFACLDCGDLLVVPVEDDALAGTVTRVRVSLPPREDQLSVQLLYSEVGHQRVLRDREGLEPYEVPVRIEDHGAVLRGADCGATKMSPSTAGAWFSVTDTAAGWRSGRERKC
jgi:hypothetical protein